MTKEITPREFKIVRDVLDAADVPMEDRMVWVPIGFMTRARACGRAEQFRNRRLKWRRRCVMKILRIHERLFEST